MNSTILLNEITQALKKWNYSSLTKFAIDFGIQIVKFSYNNYLQISNYGDSLFKIYLFEYQNSFYILYPHNHLKDLIYSNLDWSLKNQSYGGVCLNCICCKQFWAFYCQNCSERLESLYSRIHIEELRIRCEAINLNIHGYNENYQGWNLETSNSAFKTNYKNVISEGFTSNTDVTRLANHSGLELSKKQIDVESRITPIPYKIKDNSDNFHRNQQVGISESSYIQSSKPLNNFDSNYKYNDLITEGYTKKDLPHYSSAIIEGVDFTDTDHKHLTSQVYPNISDISSNSRQYAESLTSKSSTKRTEIAEVSLQRYVPAKKLAPEIPFDNASRLYDRPITGKIVEKNLNEEIKHSNSTKSQNHLNPRVLGKPIIPIFQSPIENRNKMYKKESQSKNSHLNENVINSETELIDKINKKIIQNDQELRPRTKFDIELDFCHSCQSRKSIFMNYCGCKLCNECTIKNICQKGCKKCKIKYDMTPESLLDDLETRNKVSMFSRCNEHGKSCQTISAISKLTTKFCDVCISCRSIHHDTCITCKNLANSILNGNSKYFNQ